MSSNHGVKTTVDGFDKGTYESIAYDVI